MDFKVTVTVDAPVGKVSRFDVATAVVVSLADAAGAQQTPVLLPAPAAAYVAEFTVPDGVYTGAVQAARADGSLIGTPIAITFDTATTPAFVDGVVPSSVRVDVVAL